MSCRRIAVLAFADISPFLLSIPCGVFGEDRRAAGVPRIDIRICAERPGPIATSAGFAIAVADGPEAIVGADAVIVPGWPDPNRKPAPALLAALVAAHRRGACVVGLCLGAFVLAEAGLLDQRPATSHWLWTGEFARRYPEIRVRPAALYVDAGDVVTSAGVAAGIDCCLHLLGKWHGVDIANRVARRMVVPPHRQGDQAQYIELPVPPRPGDRRFAAVLDWARANLRQPLDIDTLAERACMSRRTFTRHFRNATGTTVTAWLRHERLILAQRLLEHDRAPLEAIAQAAGFGSAVALRQLFRATFGISPSGYRRQFRRPDEYGNGTHAENILCAAE